MKGFQVKEVAKLFQSLLNYFSRRLFLILKQNVNHIYQKLEQKQKNKQTNLSRLPSNSENLPFNAQAPPNRSFIICNSNMRTEMSTSLVSECLNQAR